MDRPALMAIVLGALVVFLALIALGWYTRKRRQSAIAAPQPVPSELGAVVGTFPGFYVATTIANDRFNRVAVHGLGFRSRTDVVVAAAGVVVPIAGRSDVFIPAADITAVERATWTIDRVVETDGLIMIAWGLAETAVESYFRADDAEALFGALRRFAPTSTERDSK